MNARSGGTVTRIIVTALLLLAVSPFTAPFLTLDLKALLDDSPAPGAALVQPKTTHDETVPTVPTTGGFFVLHAVIAPAATRTVVRITLRTAFVTPLRL